MKTLLLHNPAAARATGKHLRAVVDVLGGDLDLDVRATHSKGHAAHLTADGLDRGCELVVVLAGDGTMNEAVQELAGTHVPMASLPSGSTNVWARRLGYPNRPAAAAELLRDGLREGCTRRVPLGVASGRWFAFGAGLGIDAEVVRRVDRHRLRKRVFGQGAFVASAVAALTRTRSTPQIDVKIPGVVVNQPLRMALCVNGDPFTYLSRWPLRLAGGAPAEEGLGLLGLTKLDVPTLAGAVRMAATGDVRRHPHALSWGGVQRGVLASDEPLPLQVDGEEIGDTSVVDLRSVPDALTVVVPPDEDGDR